MTTTEQVFLFMELIGTIAFAISGALVGINKNMDIFGIIVLGVITALGGGALRDITIGNNPPAMFTNYIYITVAIVSTVIVFIYAKISQNRYFESAAKIDRINNIFDAIGLGAFTVTGINVTVEAGFGDNVVLLLLMGMITGVGGGLLRDLLVREIPFVLNQKVYAVASLVGALTYYFMSMTDIAQPINIFVGVAVVFLIRMLSTVFNWNLPKVFQDEKTDFSIKD